MANYYIKNFDNFQFNEFLMNNRSFVKENDNLIKNNYIVSISNESINYELKIYKGEKIVYKIEFVHSNELNNNYIKSRG